MTKDGCELEEQVRVVANQTLEKALHGITVDEQHRVRNITQNILQYKD